MIRTCSDSELFVSVEEHSTIGGLGSAIAEELAKTNLNKRLCVWEYRINFHILEIILF